MGIKKLLFLVLFACTHIVSVQEFFFDKRVVYQMLYQTDSNDAGTKNKMELLLNDSLFLFQSLKQRQRDSVLYFHNREAAEVYAKAGGIIMRPVNKFSYKILKKNNDVQVYDSVFGMGIEGKDIIYSYGESIEDMDWKVKEDTIHLGNYICQRADLWYGNRNWIAWFVPETLISDGPYKFSGLPGLIVKITDEGNSWAFELVFLENAVLKHAINFQKWHVIKEKKKTELYSDRYQYQQNLPVITAGAKPGDGNRERYRLLRERFVRSLQNDNNWIELYP